MGGDKRLGLTRTDEKGRGRTDEGGTSNNPGRNMVYLSEWISQVTTYQLYVCTTFAQFTTLHCHET